MTQVRSDCGSQPLGNDQLITSFTTVIQSVSLTLVTWVDSGTHLENKVVRGLFSVAWQCPPEWQKYQNLQAQPHAHLPWFPSGSPAAFISCFADVLSIACIITFLLF